jgi:hypothetical protein
VRRSNSLNWVLMEGQRLGLCVHKGWDLAV